MSSPVTYEEFIEGFPEFADIAEGAVKRQLDLSNMTLSRPAWGKWWRHAVELFTAHYLALRFNLAAALVENGMRSPTAVGITTSQSANTTGLSESSTLNGLATSADAIEADFARTTYGLEYLSLLKMVVSPTSVVYSPSAASVAGIRRF